MPVVHVINATKVLGELLRVAAYCRVSTDGSDQINSYLAQINYYTRYIEDHPGWVLADIYADEGITGTQADKREDFQRLLRDCRRGLIDKVIVKSISRFARNTRDCIAAVRELQSLGISVVFEKENLDTASAGGEMFLSIYGALAQEESMSISQNMRWSYEKRMRSGRFITCRSCYGYDLVNGNLVIREDEAVIVRRVFADYLAGKGMQEIADEFNLEGIPKRYSDGEWHYSDIRYFLTNEKYVGDALLQKRYTEDALPFKRYLNKGQKAQYLISNNHPAIIERTDFDAAHALMGSRRNSNKALPENTFSGKIQCAECGSAFKRHIHNDNLYWTCWRHSRSADNCSIKPILDSEVQTAFIRLWNTLRRNHQLILSPVLHGLQEMQNHDTNNNAKLLEINREIAQVSEQNIALNQLYSRGYMDEQLYIEQSNSITAKLSALRRRRSQALESGDDETIIHIRRLIRVMDAAVELTDFSSACFDSIVEKIIVESQERIRFRLFGGFELTEPIRRNERFIQ